MMQVAYPHVKITTAGFTGQHLHLADNDIGGIAILAFFILPFARGKLALNVNHRAFLQKFSGNFCQATVESQVMPFCFFLFLAAFVLPVF